MTAGQFAVAIAASWAVFWAVGHTAGQRSERHARLTAEAAAARALRELARRDHDDAVRNVTSSGFGTINEGGETGNGQVIALSRPGPRRRRRTDRPTFEGRHA